MWQQKRCGHPCASWPFGHSFVCAALQLACTLRPCYRLSAVAPATGLPHLGSSNDGSTGLSSMPQYFYGTRHHREADQRLAPVYSARCIASSLARQFTSPSCWWCNAHTLATGRPLVSLAYGFQDVVRRYLSTARGWAL